MAYYKTNHPAVRGAVAKRNEATDAVKLAGRAFAAEFGGKAFYLRGCSDLRFGGLVFKPRKDTAIWTSQGINAGQTPRAKPKPIATEAQRAEHKTLRSKWVELFPRMTASSDDVYAAIGTNWGATMFCGIGMFDHAGWLYVETTAKLNDRMVEILGSEYEAASNAHSQARTAGAP